MCEFKLMPGHYATVPISIDVYRTTTGNWEMAVNGPNSLQLHGRKQDADCTGALDEDGELPSWCRGGHVTVVSL
jgi:hypothetical protein